MRIKTTNVVIDKEVKRIERTVQCPHCKTFMKGVARYVVQLHCWYCNKDLKIQQDPDEWTFDEDTTVQKHILERSID